MDQKRLAVQGYIAAVLGQYVAIAFVLALVLIYHGRHPEALHGPMSAAQLYVVLGSPIIFFTGIFSSQIRGDRQGVRAIWGALLGFAGGIIAWICAFSTMLDPFPGP